MFITSISSFLTITLIHVKSISVLTDIDEELVILSSFNDYVAISKIVIAVPVSWRLFVPYLLSVGNNEIFL